ncbi:MAG: Lrp/AsnC family transcriptional regulator [Candidatus Diapherotrites archaeon]|uniref:Lrp/AsnC family transcriptional regulator n=1 Tax=Candidatus Iainarchaeum sp. TaxID=3101447 RepID=A0A8T4L8T7_9ARCH|nr:Lrp/AsnC family transcriptional regulator [Candidatus Diapherotrites archaeon]
MVIQSVSIDKIDNRILQALLEDGRVPFSQIAKEVNLTDVAIKKRVESLKRKGVIDSISVNLDYKVLGFENPVFIQIRSELSKQKDVIKRISEMESVVELYQVLGEYNLLARVLVKNLAEAEQIIGQLGTVDGVVDVKTLVSVLELKKSRSLPSATLQKHL